MRRLLPILALAGVCLCLAVPAASMATLLPPRSTQVTGKLTYERTIRACTRYPRTKARCRAARG